MYPFASSTGPEPSERLASYRQQRVLPTVTVDGSDRAWLVTRYADARAALADDRLAIWFPGMPRDRLMDQEAGGFLFVMNGPAHGRIRRAVGAALGGGRAEALRATAARIAATHVDDLVGAGEPADVIGQVGIPLAAGCLAGLLGAPPELAADLCRRAADAAGVFAPPGSDQASAAEAALGEWVSSVMAAEDDRPGHGLLSALQRRGGAGPQTWLEREELAGVVLTLLLGGLIPPARALAHGLLRLLARSELIAQLRADPALLPVAVEELLRLDHAVASSGLRLATTDVELGDQPVRAGDLVAISQAGANRDPAAYPQPDRIDLRRPRQPHLSFAAGAHRCLGAGIARTELTAGLQAILTRADPRLAVPEQDLQWQPGYLTDLPSLNALPLHWAPPG